MLASEIADALATTASFDDEDATVNRMSAACIRDLLAVVQEAEDAVTWLPISDHPADRPSNAHKALAAALANCRSKGWL